jgi:hypothetical protein
VTTIADAHVAKSRRSWTMLRGFWKKLKECPRFQTGLACLVAGSLASSSTLASEILFYSSVPRNLSENLVKAFEAKNPDIEVKLFQAGTETVLEKLELVDRI